MSHSTQNSSFWRHSFQPLSWHSTEKTKPNTTKTNRRKKQSKLQQKNTQNAKLKHTN